MSVPLLLQSTNHVIIVPDPASPYTVISLDRDRNSPEHQKSDALVSTEVWASFRFDVIIVCTIYSSQSRHS